MKKNMKIIRKRFVYSEKSAYICCIGNEIITKTKTNIMTTLNVEIKAAANQSARTFTIRKYIDGKLSAKYRTYQMSQSEFDSEEMNTESDWKQFLNQMITTRRK